MINRFRAPETMKATKLIFSTVALLVLVAVAGMAYLAAYLDRHKGLLELSTSTALGRDVRIEDGVKLHWSMTPSVSLAGLRVGNPDWASGEYLVHAERAVLQFDVAALLHRRLDVKQVTVQNADIVLETATDGKRNWTFGGDAPSGIDMRIDAFQVEASRLRYGSSKGADHQVGISHLELLGVGGEELALEADLTYRDVPLSVSATSGPDTVSRSAGWPFKGRLTVEEPVRRP